MYQARYYAARFYGARYYGRKKQAVQPAVQPVIGGGVSGRRMVRGQWQPFPTVFTPDPLILRLYLPPAMLICGAPEDTRQAKLRRQEEDLLFLLDDWREAA